MQDTDLFADMGPTAVEDAWQWLPLQARITLVHFLSQLPQLAQQLSNSSRESRQQLDDALQQLVEGAELTHAQRDSLKVAAELVVCGEEVSLSLSSACVARVVACDATSMLWMGTVSNQCVQST